MYDIEDAAQSWLETFLAAHGGIAGTVHRERDGDLYLVAAQNIPAPVLDVVAYVPRGKGMAGQAQVHAKPFQTCNLQTDDSGKINPMAKLVGGQAAVALPLLSPDGEVRAVVGIAFVRAGEISPEEEFALMQAAATLP
jgi:hypothetical protein